MVRKGAHVAVFGILAILVQLALRKRSNAVLLAWFVATLCGAADEFHQTLVPNRTPSIIDIGIDSLGAAAALLLFHIMRHIVARIIRKSDAEF
jgi:VanZ family protein